MRTIRLQHKRVELGHLFEKAGIGVLGIQEHRIVHEEATQICRLSKDCHMITTSAWRNTAQAAVGGVGVLLSDRAYNAIVDFKSISKRAFIISFDGNPRFSVVCVYSPTEGDDAEVAEEFHDELRGALANLPAHNMKLVIGDLNAHLSKDDSISNDPNWYFHDRTNRNGELLRDTMLEANLEATNHRFRKRKGKMWTFLSDGTHSKSQVDYILVNKKWRNSIHNTEAYDSFSSLGSDHRLVLSKVKLSLRKSKFPPRRVFYDWGNFKEDDNLKYKYTVEVRNRFNKLCGENQEDSPTAIYGNLTKAVEETSKELLPKRQKKKRDKFSSDPKVCSARTELCETEKKYHADPSQQLREEVKEKKKKYMKTVKKTKKLINKELKGFERQVPSLKVLSAVTVCKKFKDSDEIQSLGPWGQAIQRPQRFGSGGQPIKRRPGILRGPLWSGDMGGSCLGKPQRSEDRVCGFCRFVAFIT